MCSRVPREQRWPRYVHGARQLGLKAQVAAGLWRGTQLEGVLNLTPQAEEIGQDAPATAAALAEPAVVALSVLGRGLRERPPLVRRQR